VLDNFVADKKAELNFHFIMGMIKHQNLKKNLKLKMQNEKANGKESPNSKNRGEDIQAVPKDDEQDNLITYREFIQAIKSLKNLHKTLLPRTLSFKEVLMTQKYESEFQVSDTHLDDFGMFRYEINSIFKKHQFTDETDSDLFMGRHPLSKTLSGK